MPLTNFSKILVKIHLSNFIYQTAPSVLLDLPNFFAPGDCAFTPSDDQLCSNQVQSGQETANGIGMGRTEHAHV